MLRVSNILASLAMSGTLWLGATVSASAQADVVRVEIEQVGDCAVPCDRVAVIFVHGLGGSRETWLNTSGSTQVYWPQLLAEDPELGAKLDIYRVDYDSY